MTSRIHLDSFSLAVRDHAREQDIQTASRIILSDSYGLRALRKVRRRVPIILDIGGHIGCFGIFAKSLWPEAFLIAVERDADAAELYRENLDTNGIEDAVVLNVSLTYGKSQHFLNTDWDKYFQNEHFDVQIPEMSFEELCVRFALEEISVAKFDCYESEFDLCQNISLAVATKVKLVLGQYHSRGGFDRFSVNARQAFPHLYFYGDSPEPIGPFWGFPSLGCASLFSVAKAMVLLGDKFRSRQSMPELRLYSSAKPTTREALGA